MAIPFHVRRYLSLGVETGTKMSQLNFRRTSAMFASLAAVSGIAYGMKMQKRANGDYPGYSTESISSPTGNQIVDYCSGMGRPELVVMLPGLLSSVSTMAELANIVLEQKEGLHHSASAPGVLLHNRAGYGASRVQTGRPFHLGEAVEDLHNAIEQLAPHDSKIHLIGHSLGGLLAFRYAQYLETWNLKQNLASITLLDPTHPGELIASSAQYLGAEGLDLSISLAPETMLLGGGLLMKKDEAMAYARGNSHIDRIWADATSARTLRAARREWRYLHSMMLDWQGGLGTVETRLNLIAAEDTVKKIAGHKDLYEEYLAASSSSSYDMLESTNHQSMITDPAYLKQLYDLIGAGVNSGRSE